MGDADDRTSAIGIDIGGTKIAGGVVSFPSGAVTCRETMPTAAARGGERVLAGVAALIERLRVEARARGISIRSVGVGVPELVAPSGRISSAATFDWRGLDLASRLGVREPLWVESDVRAAAAAEARFGAGRPYRLFIYITVGTGISSALVQDAVPLSGARGNALVLASGPTSATCSACGNKFQTVLEEIASGPGLVCSFNKQSKSPLSSGEEVLAAAEAGDATALAVVRDAGAALGGAVALLANVLDPEAMIIGGGLGLARGTYWESFVESTRRHIWADATRDLPILQAQLAADAGLIGAAHFAAHLLARRSRRWLLVKRAEVVQSFNPEPAATVPATSSNPPLLRRPGEA